MPDTTDLLADYDRLEREGGAAVVDRDVVEVVGPDAGRYLQGQLSQEVVALPDGGSTWSLVLQPTGKVDAWLRVQRVGAEHYRLDVDAGAGEALVARLRRFLLRTKAEVGDPERRTLLARRSPAEGVVIDDGPSDALVVAGPGVVGRDELLAADGTPAPTAPTDHLPAAALERYRIAHGVPAFGAELTEDTIPAEAGQWLIDTSVSFTKGCYTGQELVARIDSRGGNVPRPVRLLRLDGGGDGDGGSGAPTPGAEVRADGVAVGAVTSATPWLAPHQPALALAPLARSVAVGATVEVDTASGPVPATVIDPPYVGHGPR